MMDEERGELLGAIVRAGHVTLGQANRLGWDIVRGAYYGTCDDCASRWYVQWRASSVIDRTGEGHPSIASALYEVYERCVTLYCAWLDSIDMKENCQI